MKRVTVIAAAFTLVNFATSAVPVRAQAPAPKVTITVQPFASIAALVDARIGRRSAVRRPRHSAVEGDRV
jgi:hypothetical protein